jgi:hypothetical protein
MFIVNRGKAHIVFRGIVLGMLWPGKNFGAAQLLGVARQYHATLRIQRQTCHILELSRACLAAMTQGGSERQWLVAWQQRAKASLDSDLKLMKRKVREHRRMLRLGMNLFGESNQVFLASIVAAWHRAVHVSTGPNRRQSDAPVLERSITSGSTRSAFMPSTPRTVHIDIEAKDYMQTQAPIKFSRALQKVELEVNAAGVTSTNAWRHWTQSGRLDVWKGTNTPLWLMAVRDEIPKQLMGLKAAARGESARLPGLMH